MAGAVEDSSAAFSSKPWKRRLFLQPAPQGGVGDLKSHWRRRPIE
jgi:hypothetical protein